MEIKYKGYKGSIFCRNTVLFTNFILNYCFHQVVKSGIPILFYIYHDKGYEYVALDLAFGSVFEQSRHNTKLSMFIVNAERDRHHTNMSNQAKISVGAHVYSTLRRVLHQVTCKCHLCEMHNFWNYYSFIRVCDV